MSVIGVILRLSYRLRRHLVLGWSLARWLGLLLVVATLWALIRYWSSPWPAAVLAGIFLVYVLVLAWARRQGFVRFVPLPEPDNLLGHIPVPPPLGKQELLPIRASGWFTVEGQDQYYVDVEADFETVGTREHIVLGRIHPSRFLWLGQWPSYELGWWYIFFQPDMIRELRLGYLHFGARRHLGVRVLVATSKESRQAVYLTSANTLTVRRLWDNLRLDAPPGATT